jgi:hypothetical protein
MINGYILQHEEDGFIDCVSLSITFRITEVMGYGCKGIEVEMERI